MMKVIGHDLHGNDLIGHTRSGVRYYFLNSRLVAIATGNLEETSMTRYFCLPGIWESDSQTTVVSSLAELV